MTQSLTCIIPSNSARNVTESAGAVMRLDPRVRVCVVDDGVEWNLTSGLTANGHADSRLKVTVIPGVQPFVFSRNVNRAINAAGRDDVVILNDDAILKTPEGLTMLQRIADRYGYGMMSAATNSVGNENQKLQTMREGQIIRVEPRMLCFICVYISRDVLNAVGPLDERYVDYGMEDDDYCLQARRAGFRLGVYDGVYVDHLSLKSAFRGEGGRGGNFHPNMKRFIEKWGVDNRGFGKDRSPFAALFPA